MPDKRADREILLVLAEHLPEKVLHELLPGKEPKAIRELLARLAGEESYTEQPQQQTLFSKSLFSQASSSACILYTDGAARGNPGEAGAGAVLVDNDGTELGSRALYLGQCTNNVAEYKALIVGLELAEQTGCRELKICLDSELIVRQVQGSYKVKNAQLKPLFEKVKSHLAKLEKWSIQHIPRKENSRADELANSGIDDKKHKIGAGA